MKLPADVEFLVDLAVLLFSALTVGCAFLIPLLLCMGNC